MNDKPTGIFGLTLKDFVMLTTFLILIASQTAAVTWFMSTQFNQINRRLDGVERDQQYARDFSEENKRTIVEETRDRFTSKEFHDYENRQEDVDTRQDVQIDKLEFLVSEIRILLASKGMYTPEPREVSLMGPRP